jgi:hypothetical protein
MQDALALLQPSRVNTLDSLSNTKSYDSTSKVLTMLLDLHELFLPWSSSSQSTSPSPHKPTPSTSSAQAQKPKANHVTLKLAFYASKAASIPAEAYDALRGSISKKISSLESEIGDQNDPGDIAKRGFVNVPGGSLKVVPEHQVPERVILSQSDTTPRAGRSLIQEL